MSQRDVLCGAWGKPNKGLELTASSVRSFLASASGGSSGPAFGVDRAQWFICVACLMLRRACRHNTLKRLVLAW
jgi:hypothetical protein